MLTVRHLGPPIGPAAEQVLGNAVSASLGTALTVKDVALPVSALAADNGSLAEERWLLAARAVVEETSRVPGLHACVEGPIKAPGRLGTTTRLMAKALEESPAARDGRLTLVPGSRWSVRVARSCDQGDPAPSER